MPTIISIEALARKKELIRLLDEAIALGDDINRQLSEMGSILEAAHGKKKAA